MAQGIVNTAGSTLIKARAYADDVAADAESAAKAENYYPEYHADEVDTATNFYIDCANVDNAGTALFKAKARGVKKWCDLKSGAAFTIADANIKSDGIVSTDGALTATLTSYAGFNTSSSFTILFCAKIAQQDSNDDETVLFQLGNTRVLQIQQKGVDGIRLVTYDEETESHVYPTKLTEGDYTTGHYIVPLLAEGSSSDYGTYHHFAVVFDTDSQTVTWYEDGYEYTSDIMENTYVKVDGGYSTKILEKTGDGLRYFKIVRSAMTADEVKTYMDTHPHTNYTGQPKIQYDNILLELERKSPAYSTCSTAASTAAKTAGYDGFMLVNGARAAIKFTYANTASDPTLNINGTGAKPIYLGGMAASSGNTWNAGETVDFVYDGTCWQGIRPLSDENSAAEALSTATAAQTAAKTAQNTIDTHTANDNVSSDTSGTVSPAHGGTFDVVDSIERDSAGHVLKVNTTEVTLPTDNNTDTMVKQTNTETNSSYRLLMSATASDSTLTEAT
ncbi:MAG: hypothetical protein LIO59_00295 [Oscillospiraceae bacterium]|nr:hypothetical protein [Oscillospiraceae bacterium]